MSEAAFSYTAQSHPILQPRSQKGYRFALTPLADAMFQLLIFFMLTSGLTPYSLITVQSAPQIGAAESDPNAAPEEEEIIPGENARIWRIQEAGIVVGGEAFTPNDYDLLATAAASDLETRIILVVEESAKVQDLSSVLEALVSAGVTAAQIARTGGEDG